LLDLREWPLPFFQETLATVGDFKNPTYSLPIVKQWNQKIGEGDAYLFVTAEYNHSVPGVLKNATRQRVRQLRLSKQAGGHGGLQQRRRRRGARAVEHLAQIGFEADMHCPPRHRALAAEWQEAFGKDGAPTDPMVAAALKVTLDDLAWWGALLKAARPTQLVPGGFRVRAALAPR
jgi:NAD(P)H-dependent FMN reductase